MVRTLLRKLVLVVRLFSLGDSDAVLDKGNARRNGCGYCREPEGRFISWTKQRRLIH